MTKPFEINGKTFTRTLDAANHMGGLIAGINGLLNDEREPTAMAKLLDERGILQTAHGLLVDAMCEATRTETPEQTAPTATTERRECPKCGSMGCTASDDSEPDGPTHEELEGAVNLAVDASESCEHSLDDSMDNVPELNYETECLDRVRRMVFYMAGLVPADVTDDTHVKWDTLGPAAVHLDDSLVVVWPCEGTDQYPRTAEIKGLVVIPLKRVVPRPDPPPYGTIQSLNLGGLS